LRRSIGYVIQEAGLLPHLTVLENASLVPRLLGLPRDAARRRASELLTLVGLQPERHAPRLPRELSGGERQRVGLARALAADPDLMLMDEPFGALDPLTRHELQNEFDDLRRRLRKTVVLVTHDVREACRLADRIIVLHDGRIVAADSPSALLKDRADPFVAAFFRDADAISAPAERGAT
jgi:osmoprotectant transport system ATP-binding protein